MKKLIAIIMVMVMALSLCACAGEKKAAAGFSSKEEAAKAYSKIIAGTATKEEMKKMQPEAVWNYYAEEDGYDNFDDLYAEYESRMSENAEKYESTFGSDYKITSVKIVSCETLDLDEDTAEEMAELYSVKSKDITAYVAVLELTMKGSLKENTTEGNLGLLKIGDVWYWSY